MLCKKEFLPMAGEIEKESAMCLIIAQNHFLLRNRMEIIATKIISFIKLSDKYKPFTPATIIIINTRNVKPIDLFHGRPCSLLSFGQLSNYFRGIQ
jgi:hypothetical protein